MTGPVVDLHLHPKLAAVVDDALLRDIAERIERVMRGFAIPGHVDMRTTESDGPRAVAVLVDGHAVPYPPSFLRRLWFAKADPQLHAMPFEVSDPHRFPDAWLVECSRAEGRKALRAVLCRLPAEILNLRPSHLLVAEAAERDDVIAVAHQLLDRGLELPPLDELTRLLDAHLAAGRSVDDAIEDLQLRLRPLTIEVHVHREVYRRLGGPDGTERVDIFASDLDADLTAAFAASQELRLHEFAVRQPIDLVCSDRVGRRAIRIRLNARLGPTIPIPGPDEVGVSQSPQALAWRNIESRPLVDAVSGHELAAVKAEHIRDLEEDGLIPVVANAYIAAAFGRAVAPLAYRLMTVDEVEADLAQLEQSAPSLVHGVLSRFKLTTVTQLMRELAREQVSIRDTWGILNAMATFAMLREEDDGALPGDVLDDVSAEPFGVSGPWVDGALLSFTRMQLSDRVAYDTSALPMIDSEELQAYVTDTAFEARLEATVRQLNPSDRDGVRLDSIRDDVWHALGGDYPAEPVLITAGPLRRALREALAVELPGARVLARSELPPEVEVAPLGTVSPIA